MKPAVIPLVLTLLASLATAEPLGPEEHFTRAQAVFDEGLRLREADGPDALTARQKFHESAIQFAALAERGVQSSNLFVNTGNAYHFAGDNPRALLWYLRAARLSHVNEIRNGIASLRHACHAELWPAERGSIRRALMFWHYDLPTITKQRLLLGCYPLGCLMLLAALGLKWKRILIRLGLGLCIIGAVLGISDLVKSWAPDPPRAVVVEPTRGYAGDGTGYSVVMEKVQAGQEIRVLEKRNNWIKAAFPAGNTCWLTADAVQQVELGG